MKLTTTCLRALGATLAAAILSSCASISVQIRQKPYQGSVKANGEGDEFMDSRRFEAVKMDRYLWGWIDKVTTPPVPYDYYERIGAKWWYPSSWVSTEMSSNRFYTVQRLGGHETLREARKRIGVDPLSLENRKRDDSIWVDDIDYTQLMPLESEASPFLIVMFRIITLGLFWDSGYTTDNQQWGLKNEASAWWWLGRGAVIIAMDEDGNFYVRQFKFNPTETVRRAANIGVNLGLMAAELSLASQAGDIFGGFTASTTGLTPENAARLGKDEEVLASIRGRIASGKEELEELKRLADAKELKSAEEAGELLKTFRERSPSVLLGVASSYAALRMEAKAFDDSVASVIASSTAATVTSVDFKAKAQVVFLEASSADEAAKIVDHFKEIK